MSNSANKVAIITGGSRGIGQAIAQRLARDGFTVVINYAGNQAQADKTVELIEANGGKALAVQGDISLPGDVARLFSTTLDAFGHIDVVVHCAGVMTMASLHVSNLEAFDKTIAVNLRGSFLVLSQAAARVVDGGRIIALSTSVIAKNFPGYGPYIASKAGVEGLVHVLANELRGRQITVNAVAPGPVATELFFAGKSDEQVAHIAGLSPLERLGEPDDIAASVAFLAGPDGRWVNSQIVRVNGGFA